MPIVGAWNSPANVVNRFNMIVELPKNYLTGLGLSNDTDTDHDIAIAAGECRDALDTGDINLLAALVKQIDAAWAVGDDKGGLFSGSVANSTTYHVFLIKDPATGVVDAGFDTDIDAGNRPAAYALYRRIGSLYTDGSANLVQFSQYGDEFLLTTPLYYSATNPGTNAVLLSLGVPIGLKVLAIINTAFIDLTPDGAVYCLLTSPDQSDIAPDTSLADFTLAEDAERQALRSYIRTNVSGQIRYRFGYSDTDSILKAALHGWIDDRGKN